MRASTTKRTNTTRVTVMPRAKMTLLRMGSNKNTTRMVETMKAKRRAITTKA